MSYIQIVDNIVTLIGGEEVGLPLSEEFLRARQDVLCLPDSAFKELPDIGDYYKDGVFYAPGEWDQTKADEAEQEPENTEIEGE